TLASMWLIRLTDFEAPQELCPDFSVFNKGERLQDTRAMNSQRSDHFLEEHRGRADKSLLNIDGRGIPGGSGFYLCVSGCADRGGSAQLCRKRKKLRQDDEVANFTNKERITMKQDRIAAKNI